MNKKVYAVVFAAILSLSSALSAFGATITSTTTTPATPIVGAEDNSSVWWTAFSDYIAIKDGDDITIDFTNYSSKTNVWNNWVLVLANKEGHTSDATKSDYAEGYAESIVLRSDKYGWGTDYVAGNLTADFTVDENFKTMMDGAKISLNVKRTGADFTMKATIVGSDSNTYTYTAAWTATTALADTMYLFMVADSSHQVINSVTYATESASTTNDTTAAGTTNESTTAVKTGDTSELFVMTLVMLLSSAVIIKVSNTRKHDKI